MLFKLIALLFLLGLAIVTALPLTSCEEGEERCYHVFFYHSNISEEMDHLSSKHCTGIGADCKTFSLSAGNTTYRVTHTVMSLKRCPGFSLVEGKARDISSEIKTTIC